MAGSNILSASGKGKQKQAKKLQTQNDTESVTMGVTERILKQITDIYETGPGGGPGSLGLKTIADDPLLGLHLHKPRKRVSVMIVGNHSAGKSSFINWYVGETIQKTGVAIETKGFYFVTSGKKRDTLKGDATLFYYDHLEGFDQFDGIVPNLFTEVCTSKERNFSCVDFIDTPGLVDGDIHYPYDVDNAILWLADHVDLILVFFDPIGQALTARTMDVIERLSKKHNEKLRFYMSKADQVDREDDRQRVLIQITQNVTARIKSTHAFALPTFYLPSVVDESQTPASIPNAISEVCDGIDKAIRLTVQKNLVSVKTDCQAIQKRVAEVQMEDQNRRKTNSNRRTNGLLLLLASWLVLFLLILVSVRQLLATVGPLGDLVDSILEKYPDHLDVLRSPLGLRKIDGARLEAPPLYEFAWLAGGLLGAYLVLVVLGKLVWRAMPVLSKRDLKQLDLYKQYAEGILKIRDGLYRDYFKQLQDAD